jgi:hypothetical protein
MGAAEDLRTGLRRWCAGLAWELDDLERFLADNAEVIGRDAAARRLADEIQAAIVAARERYPTQPNVAAQWTRELLSH